MQGSRTITGAVTGSDALARVAAGLSAPQVSIFTDAVIGMALA
jgi:hypothetical protein